jgi:hypothetical protein
MIKYFCDRCENEFKSNGLAIPIYARDGLGAKLMFVGDKHLCDECTKKFNAIKYRLKYEEDFFDMSDEDISLTEYDFKVGDEVITSTGQVGVIERICDCERCKKRGFYEPNVKLTKGVYDIYITDNDKNNNFSNFYKIGKYKFGNVDKESIKCDIERETHNIDEAASRLEEYRKQLERISWLSCSDLVQSMMK